MTTNYVNTTIRGTFEGYRVEPFTYKDGTQGQQIRVVLTNCTDLLTNDFYDEISFNLTKSFRQFGVINDHPTLEIACRHYADGKYSFPSNVTFANSYQKFTDTVEANTQLIQQNGALLNG